MTYSYLNAAGKNASQVERIDSNVGGSTAVEEYDYDQFGRLGVASKFVGGEPVGGGDTVGVYDTTTGAWFLRFSNTPGPADLTFFFGGANLGYIGLAGDWDGNGTDTAGLYNRSSAVFFENINESGDADIAFAYGPPNSNWYPIAGDWDGQYGDSIGLYDPASGGFFLKNTNTYGGADLTFVFGPSNQSPAWIPIAGDWNGDGIDTIGLYDPSIGKFYLKNQNANGGADITFTYGPPGSYPVAGDWNDDGIDTIGVYVPSSGAWFLRNSNSTGNADVTFNYAVGGTPVVGDWNGMPTAGSSWQQTYSYDRWGNRTMLIHSNASGTTSQDIGVETNGGQITNRVGYVGTTAYSYDDTGNLLSDGVYNYKYDAAKRLRRVLTGSTTIALYAYDAVNRRVRSVTGSNGTYSLWEGTHVVAEYSAPQPADSPLSLSSEYFFLGDRMIAIRRYPGNVLTYVHP